jgi:triosephosphate isomerase
MNYLIANWKQNIARAQDAQVVAMEAVKLATHESIAWCLCPAMEHMADVSAVLMGSRVALGSQDIDLEVGADALVSLGVSYVIVGHSDRRWKLSESEEVVARKLREVLAAGMTPVLCVGERVEGEDRNDIVDTQLASAIGGLSQQERSACIVAYEPVWAISTSDSARPDTPASASSVAEHRVEHYRSCLSPTRARTPQCMLIAPAEKGHLSQKQVECRQYHYDLHPPPAPPRTTQGSCQLQELHVACELPLLPTRSTSIDDHCAPQSHMKHRVTRAHQLQLQDRYLESQALRVNP